MALRSAGAGDIGTGVMIGGCVPDSILKAAIDAAIAAGTEVTGMNVQYSTGANYELTTASDNAAIQAVIYDYRKTADTYSITIEAIAYPDADGLTRPAHMVKTFSGTASLGNSIVQTSATAVKASTTTKVCIGRVLAVNTADTTVDVLI